MNELVRLQAARDRVDDLALALDDGERGALGVVRDEVLGDAARVVGAVMQLRLLGVPVQGLDRGRREAAAERLVEAELEVVALDADRVVVIPAVGLDPPLAGLVAEGRM